MKHRDIYLTDNARNILEAMPSESYTSTMDYLNNPMLRGAVDAGQSIRLWAITGTLASWIEVTCDDNARVDIALWALEDHRPAPAQPSNFQWSIPLTKKATDFYDLEFRRTHDTLGKLAHAALGAARRGEHALFQEMANTFGKQVPWMEQASALAHRMHGPERGPSALSQALRQMYVLGDFSDRVSMRAQAMPCTTVQNLLLVHSSVHAGAQEPKLYALEAAGQETTYLLVNAAPPPPTGSCSPDCPPNGSMVWLDSTGCPIFINDVENNDARYADLPHAPEVAWTSDADDDENGYRPQGTDWPHYMAQFFNPQTRKVCEQLAAATPRELGAEQRLDVVHKWLNTGPTTQQLWGAYHSRKSMHEVVLNRPSGVVAALAAWGTWAASQWADTHPKEHAVLGSLLEGMESIGAIEEWRQQMRAISAGVQPQESCDEGLALAMAVSS